MGAVALSGLKIWSKADCCADWGAGGESQGVCATAGNAGLGATPSEILQRRQRSTFARCHLCTLLCSLTKLLASDTEGLEGCQGRAFAYLEFPFW